MVGGVIGLVAVDAPPALQSHIQHHETTTQRQLSEAEAAGLAFELREVARQERAQGAEERAFWRRLAGWEVAGEAAEQEVGRWCWCWVWCGGLIERVDGWLGAGGGGGGAGGGALVLVCVVWGVGWIGD